MDLLNDPPEKEVKKDAVQMCLLENTMLEDNKDESIDKPTGVVEPFVDYFNRIPQDVRASVIAKSMIVPKNSIGMMEFPFLGLSKCPSRNTHVYDNDGSTIKVSPFIERDPTTGEEVNYGTPTIYDFDIIIFIFSMLMKASNEGLPPSKRVQFKVIDFYRFISKKPVRSVSGKEHQYVKDALIRLRTSLVSTNIKSARQPKTGPTRYRSTSYFNFLNDLKMTFTGKEKQRLSSITVELSDWLYAYVLASDVLSIDPDYFQMSGVHRALYNHFRKHCGNQESYVVNLRTLKNKLSLRRKIGWFKGVVAKISDADCNQFTKMDTVQKNASLSLGQYALSYCAKTDRVSAFNLSHKKGVALYAQSIFAVGHKK